ncbi:MAG: 2-oxo acid dehydrogenase subunit E2, partial [Gammaproteobacteria bacterium]
MPEHPYDVRTDVKPHRSLFERLTALISPEPENRAELLEVLHDAQERNLIDADALSMTELAKALGELTATARDGKTQPAEMAGGTFTIT